MWSGTAASGTQLQHRMLPWSWAPLKFGKLPHMGFKRPLVEYTIQSWRASAAETLARMFDELLQPQLFLTSGLPQSHSWKYVRTILRRSSLERHWRKVGHTGRKNIQSAILTQHKLEYLDLFGSHCMLSTRDGMQKVDIASYARLAAL